MTSKNSHFLNGLILVKRNEKKNMFVLDPELDQRLG